MARPRTRSIVMPQGIADLSESGTWLEVLDGGAYGYKNRITATLSNLNPTTFDKASVPCVPRTILAGEFDNISVRTSGLAADTILVRFGTGEPPQQATGKDRVRWLGRGNAVSIANGAGLMLVDFSLHPLDDYDLTRERHALLSWCGWIWSKKSYTVWTTVRAEPELPSSALLAQNFAIRATGATPAGIVGTGSTNVCTLDGSTNLAGDPRAAAFLPNTDSLQVANTDVASGAFSWLVGVRG
jgi:hypothetical protein